MGAVARRYAKALFSLAQESDSLQSTATELERLAGVAANPALGSLLGSPLLGAPQRQALAGLLVEDLKLSDLLSRFVRFLAEQRRLTELPAIADHFGRQLDDALGLVRVRIVSATPLTPQQEKDIVDKFSQLTAKQVIPQVSVDPQLLGGVLVEVAGKVFDGSIRTQFHRLAAQLAGAASH
jgi:F-type H+-transporting ATPase subunit delta